MKKIVGLGTLIVFLGGVTWWLINRKSVIKNGIQSTVTSKTDSLYKLTYDSSYFDELNGNAILYNVSLKVDSSVLAQVILYDTIPGVLLNVHVKSISIQGLKSLQLLAGTSIDVDKISIESPQIQLDKLIQNDTTKKVANDSIALYKLLLSHFNFIRSKSIVINNASLKYNSDVQNKIISLANLSLSISDFNIDKEHDYKQLLGYFVKNTILVARQFTIADKCSKPQFTIDSLYYNSYKEELLLFGIQQEKNIIKSFAFNGLNTSDFVYKKLFNSKKLVIENVGLNLEEKPSSSNKKEDDSLSIAVNDMLTAVRVDTLFLRNAYISIKNKEKETVEVTGINAMLPNIKFDSVSIPLKQFLSKKEISFSVKNAFINPAKGLHRIQMWDIDYNGKIKKLTVAKLHLEPQYDKDEAMEVNGKPTDIFFVDAKNISMNDCNIFEMFLNNSIAASSINASMDFKVYENKTIFDPNADKPSDFPQKKIGEAKIDIDIPLISLTNSSIIYEEKSHDTKLISQVPFYDATVQIRNIHNRHNLNQPLTVDIHTKFLNAGDFTTHWSLPYGTQSFTINGKVGPMDLLAAKRLGRAMGAVDIKQGKLDAFSFNINADKTQGHGVVAAKYHDIKVDFLKMDDKTGDLEKKSFQSFLSNLLLRKNNDNLKPREYDFKPRISDSFFGTSWLAIFTGLKKIAM